jgi:hypothetical protein
VRFQQKFVQVAFLVNRQNFVTSSNAMKLSCGTIWGPTVSPPALENIDNIFEFVQSWLFTEHI